MASENPLKCHLPGVCPADSLSFCCKKGGRVSFLPHITEWSPVRLAQTQGVLLRGWLGVNLLQACGVGRFCPVINPEGFVGRDVPAPSPHQRPSKYIRLQGKMVSASFIFLLKCSIFEVFPYLESFQEIKTQGWLSGLVRLKKPNKSFVWFCSCLLLGGSRGWGWGLS